MAKDLAIRQSIDIMSLGDILAKSGYFTDSREAAQAIVKVLAGQELGLGPIASMTSIYIIQSKPSLSANAMAAIVKSHPKYDYRVIELTNEICRIKFLEGDDELGISEFSIKDAQQAGLTTGRNKHSWTHYTRNMLFARAVSNGVKWFCPDVTSGVQVYAPDELDAEIDGETGLVISYESIEQDREIRDYISANLNGLPGPMKLKRLQEAIEKGEIIYDSEVTIYKVAEWSK